jgi:hypothetical protein
MATSAPLVVYMIPAHSPTKGMVAIISIFIWCMSIVSMVYGVRCTVYHGR